MPESLVASPHHGDFGWLVEVQEDGIQTVLVELLEDLGISNAFVGKLQAGAVRQSHASSVLKEDIERGSIKEVDSSHHYGVLSSFFLKARHKSRGFRICELFVLTSDLPKRSS